MVLALEEIYKPEAEERIREGGLKGAAATAGRPLAPGSQGPSEKPKRVREQVGEALGIRNDETPYDGARTFTACASAANPAAPTSPPAPGAPNTTGNTAPNAPGKATEPEATNGTSSPRSAGETTTAASSAEAPTGFKSTTSNRSPTAERTSRTT